MTDKKLTDVTDNNVGKMNDSEIKKALDEAELFLRNRTMDGMSLKLNEYDIGILRNISQVCAKAYDEINRLQAENKRLSTLAELGNTRANDYRVMRDRALKAEAENEKLEAECDKQYEIAEATIRAEIADGGTSCHWCEDTIRSVAKAEAYKECIEKIKDKSCKLNMCHNDIVVKTDYQISGESLNNILKELVGEDK